MKELKKLEMQNGSFKLADFVFNKLIKRVLLTIFCFSVSFTQANVDSRKKSDDKLKRSTEVLTNDEIASVNRQTVVSGTVTDVDGPLPGVNISVKGTASGAQTDFDGKYSISLNNSSATLVFSYVGYKTKEVAVTSAGTVDVVLEQDIAGLDEVVVLGYTTRKKGELTGSVTTIGSSDIQKSSSKDIAKSLAGRASGLIISDRGGLPGAGNGAGGDTDDDATTILIRGKATTGNNSPLILIDGIPSGSFSQLAPQDIASLTVLKDGAAAIYGSRAANGVILITTSRGKSGKPKINISSSYNISQFSRFPNLMSSEQFATYQNEIDERNGAALTFTQQQIDNYASGADPVNFPNTDWADLTFANSSPESRHSLSISGGNDNVKYFVSADHLNQEGIFRSGTLGFKQNQIRSNLDIKVSDKIKLGVDLFGRFGKRKQPRTSLNNIFKAVYGNEPVEVGVYPNGLPGFGAEGGANPILLTSDESGFTNVKDDDLRARFSLDLDLSNIVNGLSLKSFAGLRRENGDTKSWYTPWTYYTFLESTNEFVPQAGFTQEGQNRILRESFRKYDEILLNATLHYSRIFGENHSVSGFIGSERLDADTKTFFAQRSGFVSSENRELGLGDADSQLTSGASVEFSRLDFFGSLSYNYDKKYFLDFTIRRDGSSNFGEGRRYGTFPSVATAWSIGEESFMENVDWLDALKIRASWSELGNDRIRPGQFLTNFNFGANGPAANPFNTPRPNFYVIGADGGTLINTFAADGVPNENVTWENAEMKNIGINFTMFNSRLSADVNYFYQKRSDILRQRTGDVPDFIGITRLPDVNIGRTKNYGVEFELSWADKIGQVGYNLGMNFSQAKNEVVFIGEADGVPDAQKQEGKPIDSYIIYPTNGVFRDQAEVDNEPVKLAGTQEGDPYYVDTNGDDVIDNADAIRVGSSNIPEIQYGIYGGVSYKNFDFSFLLQGQAEAETLVFFDQAGAKPDFVFNQRWTPDNRDASYPRAFPQGDGISGNQSGVIENFEGADFWLRDASFLRLKEIELAYTLTKDITKFGDVRIFARGFNLLTFFSDIYDLGLDPEATGYNNFRGATYPSLKTYTLGVNISF